MTNVTGACKKVIDTITNAAAVLAAIGLASIVCSYVYEVITRYIFDSPTAWASDYVSYALCVTIFLALPRVTKDRAHVAVTILVDIAPRSIANFAHVVISFLGFIGLAYAAWVSLQENIRQFTRGIETLAIVPIPQWWVSSFITFGLGMSACYMLLYLSPNNRVDGSAAEHAG
jgi:TRAP-type C4-dicarboxylate transport system permease small subunit